MTEKIIEGMKELFRMYDVSEITPKKFESGLKKSILELEKRVKYLNNFKGGVEQVVLSTYMTTPPLDSDFSKGFHIGVKAIKKDINELLKVLKDE